MPAKLHDCLMCAKKNPEVSYLQWKREWKTAILFWVWGLEFRDIPGVKMTLEVAFNSYKECHSVYEVPARECSTPYDGIPPLNSLP